MRTRSVSGGFWNTCMPQCFERSGRGLTQLWATFARLPHEASYAGNLQFFTDMVTLLENRSERSRWLVEERSRALLGRAFSYVFSYLQGRDPHFDFDTVIAPVPIAVRGDLAQWVENNVDALVRAFASDDDGVVVAADEGGVVDAHGADGDAGGGGGGDDVSDASDASDGAPEDAVSDMSD